MCLLNRLAFAKRSTSPGPSFLQEHFPHATSKKVSLASAHLLSNNGAASDQGMSKSHSESSEDFEFIETPAAPTPTPPEEDCGVRTTSVLLTASCSFRASTNDHSTLPSKMLLSQRMPLAAIPSTTTFSLPSSASCHGTWLAWYMAASGPPSSSFPSRRSQC